MKSLISQLIYDVEGKCSFISLPIVYFLPGQSFGIKWYRQKMPSFFSKLSLPIFRIPLPDLLWPSSLSHLSHLFCLTKCLTFCLNPKAYCPIHLFAPRTSPLQLLFFCSLSPLMPFVICHPKKDDQKNLNVCKQVVLICLHMPQAERKLFYLFQLETAKGQRVSR